MCVSQLHTRTVCCVHCTRTRTSNLCLCSCCLFRCTRSFVYSLYSYSYSYSTSMCCVMLLFACSSAPLCPLCNCRQSAAAAANGRGCSGNDRTSDLSSPAAFCPQLCRCHTDAVFASVVIRYHQLAYRCLPLFFFFMCLLLLLQPTIIYSVYYYNISLLILLVLIEHYILLTHCFM